MSGTEGNGAVGALNEALESFLASRSLCCLEISTSSKNGTCCLVNWSLWNCASRAERA